MEVSDKVLVEAVKDTLVKTDPKLRIIYGALCHHFRGNASASQLIRFLAISKGYKWADVNPSTMWRWVSRIRRIHRETKKRLLAERP